MSQAPPASRTFRFRPRFGLLAVVVAGFSLALLGLAAANMPLGSRAATGLSGGGALLLALLYLASPTWRLRVVVDETGLQVRSASRETFRVRWQDITEVVASPSTKTCFVSTGDPATSLIVPGEGAHAPYDIEDAPLLYDLILAAVPLGVVEEVELLSARPEPSPSDPSDATEAGEQQNSAAANQEHTPPSL